MFGYITTDPRTLSKDAKHRYKTAYCGLCRALAKKYGWTARWILSFDVTFLLLMLESVKDNATTCYGRCPYHFGRKCECACGDNADYCADAAMLLFCKKLADDVADDNSPKAKILLKILKNKYEKACKSLPWLESKIEGRLKELSQIERAGETNPDIPANVFGNLLSDVFSKNEGLRDFGFYLGRFIYLADAACDFKSDIKRARYNPLTRMRRKDFYGMLAGELQKCCECYEALDIKANGDIIENVLYEGVWLKINLKGIYNERSV